MEKTLERFLPNPKLKLREQLREVCRFRHMSPRSESAYWSWIQDFLRFQRIDRGQGCGAMGDGAAGPEAGAPETAREDGGSATGNRPTKGEWRHPRELGAAEVRGYLAYLAVERKVAVA